MECEDCGELFDDFGRDGDDLCPECGGQLVSVEHEVDVFTE